MTGRKAREIANWPDKKRGGQIIAGTIWILRELKSGVLGNEIIRAHLREVASIHKGKAQNPIS